MTEDLPLWAIQHAPLHGEPTSHEAAESMETEAGRQCDEMYEALRLLGAMTCDEIDRRKGWRPTTAGRRMPDLVRQGRAEFTGETRKTRSGRRANVYRAITEQKRGAA